MELLKKYTVIILLSLLTILLINCVPVFYLNNKMSKDNKKNIKTLSDIKWTGTKTGIENKIRINGFYINFRPGFFNSCLIFFDDGTCAQWTTDVDLDLSPKDVSSQVYWDLYKRTKGKWGYNIGVYKVEDNLITANYYYSDFLMFCNLWRSMTKIEYRIEDTNTISLVRRLEFDTNSEPPKVYQHDTIVKYKFYQSDIIPSSKNKMQKKKWMWKDADMWKKWKLIQKTKKYVEIMETME